jgi:DNA polymerase II small subunit/DNA polymerase delta subunit B
MRIRSERDSVSRTDHQRSRCENEFRESASDYRLKSARIDQRDLVLHEIRELLSTIHRRLLKKNKIIDSTDARRTVHHEKRKKKESIQELRLN